MGAAVGDHHGKVTTWAQPDANGAQPDNYLPWCVAKPASAEERVFSDAFVQSNAVDGMPLPLLPGRARSVHRRRAQNLDDARRDQRGLAVFQYLDQLATRAGSLSATTSAKA